MNQHALSRRQFLQLVAMTVAGTALAACVAAPASSGGSNAPAATQNLSFWMWNTFAPPADELMQEKLTEWGKANNITVEISRDADSNMQTKIMPAIEAGTLPDVMFVDAANALRWAVGEMERRYKLMAALGVRNLAGYNKKVIDAKAAGHAGQRENRDKNG